MKKLFTLVALLACFLGANAQNWSEKPIYSIDYTTYQGFPFYVMGYVPEFDYGYMTDFGANYKYAEVKDDAEETSDVIVKTQGGAQYYRWTEGGGWHQYFIADGISTQIDGKYKVVAKVKASEDVTINVNMGWSWSEDPVSASVAIPKSDDFVEVTWQYNSGINGSSCNLVAQPGTSTATIEWERVDVYSWVKPGGREKEWIEDIVNGDAQTPWTDEQKAIKFNDMEKNFTICAWSKEKGRNMNENDGWDPFVADIEDDPTGVDNKVFVCHGQPATTEGDPSAWDNQFWIQSQHSWKSGLTMKIKFRYMCDRAESFTVGTQFHKQTPSDYLIWHSVGDVTFKNEWQTYDKDMSISEDMAGGWSIAFNLNSSVKDAVNFYFDDLSWQYLKLDQGYFLAGVNQTVNPEYEDLDNAIQFVEVEGLLEAVIGEADKKDTYVDQLMISTTRGDDQAFKGATLKPTGKIVDDPDAWSEYAASVNAKLDVPGLGVWKVYIDEEYESMAFEMIEGTPYEEAEPIDVVTNATAIVVNGDERDDIKDDDHPDGTGAAWDNQFFIVANRALKKGEVTVLKFQYKADKGTAEEAVKTTTQCHGAPGAYMHWGCIGDVMFTTEWQEFEKDFTIPNEADGMKSIAFNMAEIKDACKYEIKDVQWYLKDTSLDAGKTYENLVGEDEKNFYVKEGAGTAPSVFGTPQHAITVAETVNGTAINTIAAKKQYEGANVVINATPAEGYEVDAVVVTCKTIDQVVEVKDGGIDEKGVHSFNFEMPADDVTVSVTFKEATTGINSIAAGKANSAVIYNLAGQRVANSFKGIVVKDGKKFVK